MVGDEGVAEHVRVRPGDPPPGVIGQASQAAGGGVAVHPGAAAVEQDRAVGATGTSSTPAPGTSPASRSCGRSWISMKSTRQAARPSSNTGSPQKTSPPEPDRKDQQLDYHLQRTHLADGDGLGTDWARR
jgi:hypothetical protein